METDAVWSTHGPAGERGGCCLNATLRDYGRIGLFALGDGVNPDGTRVLPLNWMQASTTPSPGSDGYGYLWWLSEDGDGRPTYDARGIFGQGIHINPHSNTVIVVLSAWSFSPVLAIVAASGVRTGLPSNRMVVQPANSGP